MNDQDIELEAICYNAFYINKINGSLMGLYYYIFYDSYDISENNGKSALNFIYVRKKISSFY